MAARWQHLDPSVYPQQCVSIPSVAGNGCKITDNAALTYLGPLSQSPRWRNSRLHAPPRKSALPGVGNFAAEEDFKDRTGTCNQREYRPLGPPIETHCRRLSTTHPLTRAAFESLRLRCAGSMSASPGRSSGCRRRGGERARAGLTFVERSWRSWWIGGGRSCPSGGASFVTSR